MARISPIRRFVRHPWFYLFDLGCVLTSSLLWFSQPQLAWWPLLLGLAPWALRLVAGFFPYPRTRFDPALAVFLVTAGAGVWAAYDREAAWSKFWLILAAVLLYYALAGQPRQNLWLVVGLFCALGVLVAGVFLLVQDWHAQPADLRLINRIAYGWMSIRPQISGRILGPNKVGGILAILFPFTLALGLYAWQGWRTRPYSRAIAVYALFTAGVIGFGLLMTSSRGAWLAACAALGVWLLVYLSWRLAQWRGKSLLIVLGLALLLVGALLAGLVFSRLGQIANLTGQIPGFPSGPIRLDIYENTLHLVGDFHFTGGGLGSFAGLFSRYMLVIPFFLFSYSHNFYLDVLLEQGWLGLLSLSWVYLGAVYLLVRGLRPQKTGQTDSLLRQVILVSFVVAALHGVVDNPLYANRGTPLLFFLAGLALAVPRLSLESEPSGPKEAFSVKTDGRGSSHRAGKLKWAVPVALLALAGIAAFWPNLRSGWSANLGAVLMARQELADFPFDDWADLHATADHSISESLFQDSLRYNPGNRTANHRLGLIAMQGGDFTSAALYLEAALQADPNHRGIIKNLGYCYVWLGQPDQARILLQQIPEAHQEMRVYNWWWEAQGRSDLAVKAEEMSQLLLPAN